MEEEKQVEIISPPIKSVHTKEYHKNHWRRAKKVLDAIRLGVSIQTACEVAGISLATFYRWKKRSPMFNEIYNDHILSKVVLLEEKVLELALGGDKTLLMFALKNLDKAKYGETLESELRKEANNIINVQLVQQNVTDIPNNEEQRSSEGNFIEGQARAMLTEQS